MSRTNPPEPRKDTMSPGAPITELHNFGLTFHQTGPLERAEIISVEQLAELVHDHDTDPERSKLAAVPGFGPARIQKVRAAIHAWEAAQGGPHADASPRLRPRPEVTA